MAVKQVLHRHTTYSLSYEIINPSCTGDILFLHGWGSSKEVMKQAFGKVFQDFRHLYVDLPGFGKSDNPNVLQTEDYKEIMQLFLEQLSSSPKCIAGHSFGGKLAVLLNPEELILLSSAGIPIEKSLAVKSKIKLSKILKPVLGDSIKNLFMTKDADGLPPHMYETLKNVVDEDFTTHFAGYEGKTDIFWGKDDLTTPLICGESIHALIPHSTFHPLEGDHFFFLDKGRVIEESLNACETRF